MYSENSLKKMEQEVKNYQFKGFGMDMKGWNIEEES